MSCGAPHQPDAKSVLAELALHDTRWEDAAATFQLSRIGVEELLISVSVGSMKISP